MGLEQKSNGGVRHDDIIADMVRRIVDRTSPEKVILYGSCARGEAGRYSDIDMLVVFRELPDARRTVAELYDAVSGSAVPKDLVATTVAALERYRGVVNTIYYAASREGKILYERQA